MRLFEILKGIIPSLEIPAERIDNLKGSSKALFLAMQEEIFIAVEPSEEAAFKLFIDIEFYLKLFGKDEGIRFMPSPEGADSSGQRAAIVYDFFIATKSFFSIIASADALAAPLWYPEILKNKALHIKVSDEKERAGVEQNLIELGYKQMPFVSEKGQYSMRGWILDIFPSTMDGPVRFEFFGDVLESIRGFDIGTQRSTHEIHEALILPAAESDAGINPLELFRGDALFSSGLVEAPPEGSRVLSKLSAGSGSFDAGTLPIAGLGILHHERRDVSELSNSFLKLHRNYKILIVSSSKGQAERIKEILAEGGAVAPVLEISELGSYEGFLSITIGNLSEGLHIPGLLILTEEELFGGRPGYRAMKKSDVSGIIRAVEDFKTGDFVVHRDYGIGKFTGLARQNIEGNEYELMSIEYSGGDTLYLPLYAIDKVQKYRSREGASPGIDRLGSGAWQRTTERVRKRIKEIAEKLLRLYAEREVAAGHPFSPDTELHREFDGFFQYEETPDQLRAIAEIKKDMESARPMDRLLCGDVGYGKTEVAMRAVFKAVFDGKQVAVLAPTTLLCEQHLRIFKKRFSAFPVNIDYLSRFKGKKEQKKTLEELRKGKIEILIATHALFKKEVSFFDLGLLVVDEEHRFGVRQKEILKEIAKGVDVLTLTATPIPRTLQMALSGIRKLSIIETPPEERLAVKSAVALFNASLIREAIVKELQREGQVFFVHNRISDIDKTADFVKRQVPEARIALAHGQMPEKTLEKIMMTFLNGDTDVLVSTAIIGSGLDIPTVNTIIIDMAHRMGLADLYQLKGRVGRSNIKAYAYYLIPGEHAIDGEAGKRLRAIEEMSYIGAGLRLAMRDLEIRGAGNLLGGEQSGFIDDVGLDLYIEMLERAVSELRGEPVREKRRPSIHVRADAFIPEEYIQDAALRLSVYRQISSAQKDEDLLDIEAEMKDRFGKPPEPFMNLLRVMKLSLTAEGLDITEVRQTDGRVRFAFRGDKTMNAEDVLKIFGGRLRFYSDGFEVFTGSDSCEDVQRALDKLATAGVLSEKGD